MLPSWLVLIILVLGVYRIFRLIGWDDFPPVVKIRTKLVGETVHHNVTESRQPIYRFKRPILQHFITCPYCLGFWLSLIAYLCWRFEPTGTLYALLPFAVSGGVGLVSKLD